MSLDIGKAFTFISDDPNGVTKLLIGGGLVIAMFIGFVLIIPGFLVLAILTGYLLHFCRNVINGSPMPMPEWDDFGAKMAEGFKGILVGIVYGLPVIIVATIFVIPQIVLSATGNDAAAVAGLGIGVLGQCLTFLAGLLTYFVLPVGMARLAANNGNLGSAFQFGEVFAILRQNIANYIIIALLAYFVGQVITSLGLIVCLIGAAFTGFYSALMQYHLYGQAYRAAQGIAQVGYSDPYGQRPF